MRPRYLERGLYAYAYKNRAIHTRNLWKKQQGNLKTKQNRIRYIFKLEYRDEGQRGPHKKRRHKQVCGVRDIHASSQYVYKHSHDTIRDE